MKDIRDANQADQSLIAGVLTGNGKWVRSAMIAGADVNIFCREGFGVTDAKPMTLLDAAIFLKKKGASGARSYPMNLVQIEIDLERKHAITLSALLETGFKVTVPLRSLVSQPS